MLSGIGFYTRKSTVQLLRLVRAFQQPLCSRYLSAWIAHPKPETAEQDPVNSAAIENLVDVERLFTMDEVQNLLKEICGRNAVDKIFSHRIINRPARSHYALMNQEMYDKTIERIKLEGQKFLQFFPFKEPRNDLTEVLGVEKDLRDFDQSKFIFVDITFDVTDAERTIVVRETDGTLRTATPEEHDRMNRTFFEDPARPVDEPAIFKDPWLQEALDREDHGYIMDWACYFFEPDSPQFVKLCRKIFDRIVQSEKFCILHSTRHYGPLVFYLLINDNIHPLLNYYGRKQNLEDAAKLIRLKSLIFPNWKAIFTSADSNETIISDYIKRNEKISSKLMDIITCLESHTDHWHSFGSRNNMTTTVTGLNFRGKINADTKQQRNIDRYNIQSEQGPLEEMAKDYPVTVIRSSEHNEKIQKPRNLAEKLQQKSLASKSLRSKSHKKGAQSEEPS